MRDEELALKQHSSNVLLLFIHHISTNIQRRWYGIIVRTADKTGYTLFPQYTIKIPSDCNRTVIVCLSTLFTRLGFFDTLCLCTERMWSFNWKGVIERLCWMEVLSVFSPRVWIKNTNMHAQICVQSKEGSKHCLRAVTVYWKKLYFQSQLQQHGTKYLWYSSIVSTLHLTLTAYDNDNPLTDEWSWDHVQWSLWNPTSLLCLLLWSL